MIRVIMAEDFFMLRESIKFMIESDPEIKVVATADNGIEAFELCRALKPDVVLMDIMMPVCDGVKGTRLIKELGKSIKVIILTTFKDDRNIEKALKNGADGYVLKDMDPHELINVIKTVKKGLSILQTDILAVVSRKFNMLNEDKNEYENGYRFSERELSIVRHLVDGKSYREIAGELFITEGTIKNTVSELLKKLGLKDRLQLAVFAVKNKLI